MNLFEFGMRKIITSSFKLKLLSRKFNNSIYRQKIPLNVNKRYCSQFLNNEKKNFKIDKEPKALEDFLNRIEVQLSENPRDIKQWINKATTLNKLKKHNKAIESCNVAISLCTEPDNQLPPNAIRDMFIAIMAIKSDALKSLKSSDTYEKSLKYFDLILSLEPNFAPVLIAKAEVLIELKSYSAALKCLSAIDKPNPDALNLRGISHAKIGEFTNALKCFEMSLEINDVLETKLNQIDCIYSMGNIDKAIAMLQDAFNKYSDPIEKYEICKALGNIYTKNNDFKKALKHFEMAKNLNTEEPEIWFILYRTLSYMDSSNSDKARKKYISFYLKKHEIVEKNEETFLNIANQFLMRKNYFEAIVWYQESLTIENSFEAFYGLASSLKALDINELALKHFKKALQYHPDDKNALLNIANLYIKLNQVEEGLKIYNLIFEKYPHDESAAIGIISTYIMQKRYDDIINLIDNKLQYPLCENIEILSQKALAFTLMGNTKEAIEIYLNLTEKYPNKGYIWMNLSLCLMKLDKIEEALECSEKAQEISPDDPNIWSQHAILCLLLQKYKESWEALNRAEVLNQSKDFPDPILIQNIERTRSQIQNILSSSK